MIARLNASNDCRLGSFATWYEWMMESSPQESYSAYENILFMFFFQMG